MCGYGHGVARRRDCGPRDVCVCLYAARAEEPGGRRQMFKISWCLAMATRTDAPLPADAEPHDGAPE
jgi:hypothetical protein